jgi:hypothetical protein
MRSTQVILMVLVALLVACSGFAADRPRPTMRGFMGINTHTVQFDPKLYRPLCELVRDYHPLGWDLDGDSAAITTFPMARHAIGWSDPHAPDRKHQGRVDWQKVYGSWLAEGYEIDASIMLGNFTPEKWKDIPEDAYRYGKAFAEYFGPSGPNKLVMAAEIGNEPAGQKRFDDESYQKVFQNMARGLRDGDPKLKILTCTAHPSPDSYSKSMKLFQDTPELYDVINVHEYAMIRGWPTWERSFPEDPTIKFMAKMHEAIAWRDKNAPDKEIWLTEFGYDASTQEPPAEGDFKDFKDVTDVQQAQWIVRSFLVLSATDIQRAYLYWFNDSDACSLHAASGVTRFFKPKPSFWSMAHLYSSLGDYRFHRAVRSDEKVYVYEYVHGTTPNKRVWVIWSPTGKDVLHTDKITLPGRPVKSERMPMREGPAPVVEFRVNDDGAAEVPIAESPLYLFFE